MTDAEARITALEILVEQLIVERCAMTDDPLGTAEQARDRLTAMAQADTTGRITHSVAAALTDAMQRVVERIEGMAG
ncbi:hypothetical protein [Azospirillum canadense]|uniref:hypothetical protein n=1 Tax=Azospirillum canadense TaxID=403962 RepID=UPI0022264995|nr:hypothetical protein [Azospirillum canadense]MCW2242774.1 hypothetical protein [Azospirillum canadense]